MKTNKNLKSKIFAALVAATFVGSSFATVVPTCAERTFGKESQSTQKKTTEEKKPKKEIEHMRSTSRPFFGLFGLQKEIMDIKSNDATKTIRCNKKIQEMLKNKGIKDIRATNPLDFEKTDTCGSWKLVTRRDFMPTPIWEMVTYPNANNVGGLLLSKLGVPTFHIYTNASAGETASKPVNNEENSFSFEEFDNELGFTQKMEEDQKEAPDVNALTGGTASNPVNNEENSFSSEEFDNELGSTQKMGEDEDKDIFMLKKIRREAALWVKEIEEMDSDKFDEMQKKNETNFFKEYSKEVVAMQVEEGKKKIKEEFNLESEVSDELPWPKSNTDRESEPSVIKMEEDINFDQEQD